MQHAATDALQRGSTSSANLVWRRSIKDLEENGSDDEDAEPVPVCRQVSIGQCYMNAITPTQLVEPLAPISTPSGSWLSKFRSASEASQLVDILNANVAAFNDALSGPAQSSAMMLQTLLNVHGYINALLTTLGAGRNVPADVDLAGINALAAWVTCCKPRVRLLASIDRYRSLKFGQRSLRKRRGTLLRIEEGCNQVLHCPPVRLGGRVLEPSSEQIEVLRDARRRSRLSQIWVDYVMKMYQVLSENDVSVSWAGSSGGALATCDDATAAAAGAGDDATAAATTPTSSGGAASVHAAGSSDATDGESSLSLHHDYKLEKWSAPVPIASMFVRPYYAAWAAEHRDRGDDISFMHFLLLQLLRPSDLRDVMSRDVSRFEALFERGLAQGVPAARSTVTYLTSPEQRRLYEVSVRDGRLYMKDAEGADQPMSTASNHTSWRVTGRGFAMVVWRHPGLWREHTPGCPHAAHDDDAACVLADILPEHGEEAEVSVPPIEPATAAAAGSAPLAADEPSGLFAADHMTNEFHHSSIFAGEAVDFAGEIRVVDGRLLELNNKSGHYKPRPRQVLGFLHYLAARGVRLKDVTFRMLGADDKGSHDQHGQLCDADSLRTELVRQRAKKTKSYYA